MDDHAPIANLSASNDDADISGDPRLRPAPRGAFALAGVTVGLLVAAWLAVYFLLFLTRGPVG